MMMHSKITNINNFCNDLNGYTFIKTRSKLDLEIKLNNIINNESWKEFYKKKLTGEMSLDKIVKYCIDHSAQQFCFFYGKTKIMNSSIISDLILNQNEFEAVIKSSLLPFIDKRLFYLKESKEIVSQINLARRLLKQLLENNEFDVFDIHTSLYNLIDLMLTKSCFNEDPFFKKGLLAIFEIRRYLDIIEEDSELQNKYDKLELRALNIIFDKILISKFPIPADYRVPQILAKLGILNDDFLDKEFIKDSIEEITLRKNTIEICNTISKELNIPPYILDAKLFSIKNYYGNDFHKCITTYY